MNIFILILIIIPRYLKAEDNIIIKNVCIEGLYRISKDYVISKIPFYYIKEYKIDNNNISNLFNSIISTKHFSHMKLLYNENNSSLIIKLIENPIIISVDFIGNKLLNNDFLKKIFIEKELYINDELSNNKLFNLISLISNLYKSIGNYNVKIETDLLNISPNKIKLKIIFNEGKSSIIKSISINGNNNIKSNKILNKFKSFNNRLKFMNLILRSVYIEKNFEEDLDKMKSLYEENGYFDFIIKDKKITFSEDKSKVFINLYIYEGNKYSINDFELVGDFDSCYYDSLNNILNKYLHKKVFNIKKIKKIKNEIKDFLISKGYSFPMINTKIVNIDNTDKKKLKFNIICNYKFNVRNILISGNNNTLDKVIRREIYQSEFSTLNINLICDDVDRLNKLKLFKKIDVKTISLENNISSTKLVDLLFDISEMNTSGFKVGLSLNENYNPNIKLDFIKSNFLCKNSLISLIINYNKDKANVEFIISDPYFFNDERIKSGSKIFYSSFLKENEYYSLLNINYGISNFINLPMYNSFWSDYELIFHINETKVNYYDYFIFDEVISLSFLKDFFLDNEEIYNRFLPILNKSYDFLFFASFNYDSLNHNIFPTNGKKFTLNCKSTLPLISDNKYYICNITFENYFTNLDFMNLTFFNKTQIYSICNLFKKNIPFYNYFYLDKIDLVRGFKEDPSDYVFECVNYIDSSILERDNIFSDIKIIIKNELCIPTETLLGYKYNNIARLSYFMDFGFEIQSKKEIDNLLESFINIFEYEYMRHVHLSTGLTFRIASSTGLINFSYIIPILKCSPYEKMEKFQFSINKKW
ncbi:outer membrane protein assembly factor BamA [endosymbiont of Pachyrhynchus infernalis]|uniref:outer membrane protein assembly factor BamA n=1 Tax=endosymbiont of Pachyrhynchus infernalis TaxID=1971488 RepID=UPI0038B6B202